MIHSSLILWAALAAGGAQAQNRGTLAPTVGGGMTLASPRFSARDPAQRSAGCGGLDAFVLPGGAAQRETRRRWVISLAGCAAPWGATGGFGAGPGGQWGRRDVYLTAHVAGGLGGYYHQQGTRSYETLGLWLRPRAAVGVRLPGLAAGLEIGPTVQYVAPLITEHTGTPAVDGFGGMVSLDVSLTYLNVSPRRRRR